MKKYLLLAAAALSGLAACENTEIDKPAPEPDEISVSFDNDEFDSKGGEAYVEVTSSGDWTLELKVDEGLTEDDYKWVEPSANAGSDGDVVIFDIKGNDSAEKDLEATFVFACGEATDEFTVRCLRKDAVPDKIELSLTEKTFEAKGGSVTTKVISSADWTLAPVQEGGYSWITVVPEAMTGKNGDEVIFTVSPEGLTADDEAEFIFTVGKKTASFKIYYKAAKEVEFTLESASEVLLSYLSHSFQDENAVQVKVRTEFEREEIQSEVTGNGSTWLTYVATSENTEGVVTLTFEAEQNDSGAERNAVIELTAAEATPLQVHVTQMPKSSIVVVSDAVNINQMGGDFNVTVNSNVEYEAAPSASWITFKGKDDNGVNTFTAEPYNDVERTATITFTEKNPLPGTEAATATIDVTQKMGALIEMAAEMHPDDRWVDLTVKGKAWVESWNKPDVLNNLTEFTLETLVYYNNYYYFGGLMGVENQFYICGGDVLRTTSNLLCVEYGDDSYLNNDDWDNGTGLGDGKWYHIAVTMKDKEIVIYIDGADRARTAVSDFTDMDFAAMEDAEGNPQKFLIGYSEETGKSFNGKMSEVRIWNKALTQDEINAPLHFYNVDPASPGLVAYWKFNEGEGTTIKDHTSNGNDLTSEGIVWTEVSLPE